MTSSRRRVHRSRPSTPREPQARSLHLAPVLDGQVLETNQAFLQIVGYERAELESSRLGRSELTPAEWHDRDAQAQAELSTLGTAQP